MTKKELEIGTALYIKEPVYKMASSIVSIHPPGAKGRKEFHYKILINGIELMLSKNQIFSLFDLDRKDKEMEAHLKMAKERLKIALARGEEDAKKIDLMQMEQKLDKSIKEQKKWEEDHVKIEAEVEKQAVTPPKNIKKKKTVKKEN